MSRFAWVRMRPIRRERESVSASLAAGHLVVLCCRCDPSIEAAREASRQASAWLTRMATFGRGRLSRSAAPGMGVVAANLHFPVGIDVEAIVQPGTPIDRRELLHPVEDEILPNPLSAVEFAALWARKEAVLKACGVGLAVKPAAILTGARDETWQRVVHRGLGTVLLRSLAAPSGFAIAVATPAVSPPPVLCLDVGLAFV